MSIENVYVALKEKYGDRVTEAIGELKVLTDTAKTRQGTMKAWLQSRNGQDVYTYQIDTRNLTMWVPGARTISARATYANLGDSRRDYQGMKVLGASDDVLIVADDWHTIVYSTVPARTTRGGI